VRLLRRTARTDARPRPASSSLQQTTPNDLVTVSCCEACNRELCKHDEYFRIAITTGIDREKFPKETADSVRAINSLIRPASQGFARLLLQNYEPNSSRLRYDAQRIEIALYRITRGLYFHHRKARVPGTIAFAFRLVDSSLKIGDVDRERIDRLGGRLTSIGQGVFRYGFEPFEPEWPDPFGTVWLMRFYDHKTFFCITASE
jgi:hypothetical protein